MRRVRNFIIALPAQVVVLTLLLFFMAVCFAARRIVLRRCDEETREELADQAKGLLTGLAATFAFFIGFAISISWGAVSAAQSAVEQQTSAIQQASWEIRNMPNTTESAILMDKLRTYVSAAADLDAGFLARGVSIGLPSAVPLDDLETALRTYTDKRPDSREASRLSAVSSSLVSSSASVAAVANRALPQALIALLMLVAILVSASMGISTVTYGRRSMVFVGVWCLVPALSLTVVLALAYPFALRSGLTLAPLKALAEHMALT